MVYLFLLVVYFYFLQTKQHFFRKISQPWTKALALRCLALKSNERWQAWSMLHRYGLVFQDVSPLVDFTIPNLWICASEELEMVNYG